MDANYCVVPFRGRHAELADLERWCMDDRAVLVRLYTGPGGVGKTRLLLAFIRQLPTSPPRERWHAGFLSNHAEVADPVILDHLMTHPDRVLVVIDNAEVRWEEVRAVLSKAAEAEYGRKVRVVLLARGAVEWWEAMKRRPDPVGYLLRAPATTGVSLPRFSLDVRENTATFYDAAQAFAEHLNLDGSNVVMPDLPDHYHDTILLIHMAAFAAIHGQTLSSDHELLDFFLDRERYFWDERKPREISSAAFAQAAAIITGFGGADGPEAACRLIRRARLMRGQPEDKIHQVAEALRSLYPGPRWLNPVQPDLAGERLVQRVLAGQL